MGMQAKATEKATWSATTEVKKPHQSKKWLTALVLSFSAANSKTSSRARTHFYLHASLPSRGCMVTYSITRPRFYTVCSLCPAITPRALPLLTADERLMGWGACRGEKGKKALLPCSAMLSFLFLLCQTSEQPCLPLRCAPSLPMDCFVEPSGLLTISRCFVHKISGSYLLIPRKGGQCCPTGANRQMTIVSAHVKYISTVCVRKRKQWKLPFLRITYFLIVVLFQSRH